MMRFLQEIEPELNVMNAGRFGNIPDAVRERHWNTHKNNNVCYVCGDEVFHKAYERQTAHAKTAVFDHDHCTGAFRGMIYACTIILHFPLYSIYSIGTACNSCNTAMKEYDTYNVYFHNFCGFDSHILASEYVQTADNSTMKVEAIPNNTESVKMFKIGRYNFLDSYSFQPQALSRLSDNITADKKAKGQKLDLIRQVSELCHYDAMGDVVDEEMYDQCQKKAVFPYTLAGSINQLLEIQTFPPLENFTSSLNGAGVNLTEFENGRTTFARKGFSNLMQYYAWYCCKYIFATIECFKSAYTTLSPVLDVCLLAEVMSGFKERTKAAFNVSPDGYWTLPSMVSAAHAKHCVIVVHTCCYCSGAGLLSKSDKNRNPPTDRHGSVFIYRPGKTWGVHCVHDKIFNNKGRAAIPE